MEIEKIIKSKGYNLPESSTPLASYVNGVISRNLLFISGKLPVENGKIKYTGKVGKDLTFEQGYDSAKLCALHALASAREVLGDLDRIVRVVKVTGFVNAAPGFVDIPKVINGASALFVEIFGDKGKHARSAIGVSELPLNSSVEVEVIFEIRTRIK
jgi:enamine deaminase RidA (YjgF/YER057c/UK114 family)